jgi:polysaccharide chain length determinant protein (PEP-CTERM system associated)
MAEKGTFQIQEYLEIIWYRKWLLVVPIVVMVAITAIGSKLLPNIYRGETLILVEPQKIPEEFVRSTVSLDLDRRIGTLKEQLLSRTRLEKIIREVDLFPGANADTDMELLVGIMRGNIEVSVQARDSFRIYFTGRDPYKVQLATNMLADTFIQENLRDREKQAVNTLSFLDTELEHTKKQLEEQEEKIRQFKQEHMGELPEQQEANQRKLDRLQEQLATVSTELAQAENRKVVLQNAIADLSKTAISQGNGADLVSIDTQIERLNAQLADLKLKYTDAHPDVKRVRAEISKLERQRQKDRSTPGDDDMQVTSQNRDLIRQLRQVNLDIDTLRAERSRTRADISDVQVRVESAPEIESNLQILTRDYDKTKENHDDLLKKRQEAERSANLELKQKGEQFKVIDPARLPRSPFKPKRVRIVIFGFLLGAMIGFGSIFLAEHFDNSFRSAQEVEDVLGIAVLATVPRFRLRAPGQFKRKVKLVLLILGAILAFAAIVVAVISIGFGIDPISLFGG